jgi:hypothetical protein
MKDLPHRDQRAMEAVRHSSRRKRWRPNLNGRLILSTSVVAPALAPFIATALAGCEHPDRRAPMPTVSSTTPISVDAAMRDAVDAYTGMWAVFTHAVGVPDPDSPQLSRYASGSALRWLVTQLFTYRTDGETFRGSIATHPSVTGVQPIDNPSQVLLADCVDDTNWHGYHRDGTRWADQSGGQHRTTATVQRSDTTWTVTAIALEGGDEC